MQTTVVEIPTGTQERVVDLTVTCEEFLAGVASRAAGVVGGSGNMGDGLLHVFVPHATAGVAIIETGAGSDDDLLAILGEVLPSGFGWRHRHGTAGHGRDHVLPAFIAPYASLPVIDGRLALGTWQRICLVDTNLDNRLRRVRLSYLTG